MTINKKCLQIQQQVLVEQLLKANCLCIMEVILMAIDVKCPKCGSGPIERLKNQEQKCSKCGYVFYFVTPECGSQLDFSRYKL